MGHLSLLMENKRQNRTKRVTVPSRRTVRAVAAMSVRMIIPSSRTCKEMRLPATSRVFVPRSATEDVRLKITNTPYESTYN
jgi:hypothetical protein